MIKPIKTNSQYESALKRIYKLMQIDLKSGSEQADELEVLSVLVDKFEEEHFQIYPPNPVEALKFRMEQLGMSKTELSQYLGHKSRVSEVLSGKRKLSLSMIRTLHEKLNIPAESLISKY